MYKGINYEDIADPRGVYNNDTPGAVVENAIEKLAIATGKKLVLVCDKHNYTTIHVTFGLVHIRQ